VEDEMTNRKKRNKKCPLIAFELSSAADLKRLKQIAELEDRSVSSLLRSAVAAFLASTATS